MTTALFLASEAITQGEAFLACVIALPKGRSWVTHKTQALRQGKILVDTLEGKLPQEKLHQLIETLYTIEGTAPEMMRLLHIADVVGNINPIFRQPMLDCLVAD